MELETIKRVLLRAFVRVGYWPSLLAGRLMYKLGVWQQWDAIDEHVILGAIPVWGDLKRLRALGVIAVINLCEEFPGEPQKLTALGMTQLHLPTLDYHCPSLENIYKALDFIRSRSTAESASCESPAAAAAPRLRGKVYIHCKAGRGRSAAVALCYLMVSRGLTAADAARRLKQLRPAVRRHIDQDATIRAFDASCVNRVP